MWTDPSPWIVPLQIGSLNWCSVLITALVSGTTLFELILTWQITLSQCCAGRQNISINWNIEETFRHREFHCLSTLGLLGFCSLVVQMLLPWPRHVILDLPLLSFD